MLQPLGKRIIIAPIQKEKKSTLLHIKQEPVHSYTVIAIGDDVKKVNVNDIIIVDHYAVSDMLYEDITYYMIHEDNIHAKVKAS